MDVASVRARTPVDPLLLVGVGLLPLYLLPTGYPQLSHLLLGVWALASILSARSLRPGVAVHLLAALVVVICLRQFAFAVEVTGLWVLMPTLYAAFNLLLFAALTTPRGEAAVAVRNSIEWGFFLGTGIVAVSILLTPPTIEGFGRFSGPFRMPGQLGYYALIAVSVIAVRTARRGQGVLGLSAVWLVAAVSAVAGASRAAVVLLVLQAGLWLAAAARGLGVVKWFGVLTVAGVILATSWTAVWSLLEASLVFERLSRLDGSNPLSLIEGRGYHLLTDLHGWRLLWGMGEGSSYLLWGQEIHSTFGSIAHAVGLPGLILFVLFLGRIGFLAIRDLGLLTTVMVFSGPLAFGVTHNGFRFVPFWVLLALLTLQGRGGEASR